METTREPVPRRGAVRHIATAWPGGETERRLRTGARWLSFTLVAVTLAVAAAVLILHAPAGHIKELAIALAVAGAGALLLGEVVLRTARIERLGGVWLKLAIPPLLTAAVIALSVLALANAMFISPQDTTLLLVFLGFAVLVALMLAGTLAAEIARSIARVETGARRIAQGDYAFRVADDNTDARELRQLARWFNTMAGSVEEAFAQRERAEVERRRVLAALSHDLRTPLASVRAMIEAIDDGVAADEQTVRRYQRAIRAEVRRLSQLIDDFFDLSRLESGALMLQRERLGIDDVISDALEAFHEQAARAGIRLEGRVDDGLPTVALDPRQIARALANLLQNALRHTAAGGAVIIRVRNQQSTGSGHADLLVQVLDSGSGIAASDLPHIFEHAYRSDASRSRQVHTARQAECGSGAGLGLTIARGIVELHGGHIWAISPLPDDLRLHVTPMMERAEPFAGAALCFTLPCT